MVSTNNERYFLAVFCWWCAKCVCLRVCGDAHVHRCAGRGRSRVRRATSQRNSNGLDVMWPSHGSIRAASLYSHTFYDAPPTSALTMQALALKKSKNPSGKSDNLVTTYADFTIRTDRKSYLCVALKVNFLFVCLFFTWKLYPPKEKHTSGVHTALCKIKKPFHSQRKTITVHELSCLTLLSVLTVSCLDSCLTNFFSASRCQIYNLNSARNHNDQNKE